MGARRRPLIATSIAAAVVASCAASSPAAPVGQPRAGVVTDSVPALATDQACTRQAGANDALRPVPFRTDDIRAMTLPQSRLGSAVSGYAVDWWHYGFMDNAELRHIDVAPDDECALNRTHGRITGFSRGYMREQIVATAAHLFFTPNGASSWLDDYVAGMKDLPGSSGVNAVRVTSLPDLASDAVQVTLTGTSSSLVTWIWFRRGQVLGSVLDLRQQGQAPVLAMRDTARKLARSIADRMATVDARAQDPADAVMALSAGLPKTMLGSRYAGLVWDWFYGGCWDPQEAAGQTPSASSRREYLADAARYHQLTFCRSMYVPPHHEATSRKVARVFTGGTLYATAADASGALAETVQDWKDRAGTTDGGISYGSLSRFDAGNVGQEAVGLRQRSGDLTSVRILFRHGRYIAVAALSAQPFAGMVGDVRSWAQRLDRRVTRLLTTRTA